MRREGPVLCLRLGWDMRAGFVRNADKRARVLLRLGRRQFAQPLQ